jgi:hypothetical protein
MELAQVKAGQKSQMTQKPLMANGFSEVNSEEFLLALSKVLLASENTLEISCGNSIEAGEINEDSEELAEMIAGVFNLPNMAANPAIENTITGGAGSDAKTITEALKNTAEFSVEPVNLENGKQIDLLPAGRISEADPMSFDEDSDIILSDTLRSYIAEAEKEPLGGNKHNENLVSFKSDATNNKLTHGINTGELELEGFEKDYGSFTKGETKIEQAIEQQATERFSSESLKAERSDRDSELKFMDSSHLRMTASTTAVANSKVSVQVSEASLPKENIQIVNDTIIELVETTTEGEASILKVKLYPEELGTVDIALKMEKGKLTASILVESDQIKSMLDKSINELKENLLKQNLQLEKIDIDLNFESSQHKGFKGAFHEGFNQNQHHMKGKQLLQYHTGLKSLPTSSLPQRDPGMYRAVGVSILA